MSLLPYSNSYKHKDRYKVSRNVFNLEEEEEDKNNYQFNEKKKTTFGKMMNKFKNFSGKVLTAKQIRENKDFKETKHFQEGNNFIHISKNLKNKKSGAEITQEVRIKGGTTNNQYNYDNFLESEQLPKKNWNSQNKKKKEYKSKKKCRYGLKCRNKKNCKFNHDNDYNQPLQNYQQNNDKFFFDDNFAATFFS
jgi:hypothetical protein